MGRDWFADYFLLRQKFDLHASRTPFDLRLIANQMQTWRWFPGARARKDPTN